MKFPIGKIAKPIFVLFILLFTLSCNKDSELLEEHISDNISKSVLVEVRVLAAKNESVVINPLIINQDSVSVISEVSEPAMGTVEINEDNSITYTPDEDLVGTDEFTYTTETENEEEPETGSITVSIREPISEDVAHWQEQFDIVWNNPSTAINAYGMAKCMDYALSGGHSQEYYYLAWQLDAVIQIWQATGDNAYLDDALKIIETCISKATSVRGGQYLGWSVTDLDSDFFVKHGSYLYESYLFRFVATLLRIMHQSPNLREMDDYQSRYENILEFTEVNIFEKWYTKSPEHDEMYLLNAHMSSHFARIGMELYIIKGDPVYKEVFDNISFKGLPNRNGANLRDQLHSNPKVPSAYTWASKWDSPRVQDTSHGSDIVSFWVTAYENDMYWNKDDIDALISTLNDVVWTVDEPLMFTANVDGTDGSNEFDAGFHCFISLGRFSEKLQSRIERYYTIKTVRYKTSQAFGTGALNRKILNDGRPVYPENY